MNGNRTASTAGAKVLRGRSQGWRLGPSVIHDWEGFMPGFVQIIEFKTSQPDEIKALAEEFRTGRGASEGHMPLARGTITQDRERPGIYLNIVEFDSYEAAMANSNLPETQKFAERMSELCDGPPKFLNLDVVDAWER